MRFEILVATATVVGILALPSLVSAWADRRRPRAAAVGIAVSTFLFFLAHRAAPDGLQFADIPLAFARIIRQVLYG